MENLLEKTLIKDVILQLDKLFRHLPGLFSLRCQSVKQLLDLRILVNELRLDLKKLRLEFFHIRILRCNRLIKPLFISFKLRNFRFRCLQLIPQMLVFLLNLGNLVSQFTIIIKLLTLFLAKFVFKLDDFFECFLCLRLEELFFLHFFPKEVLSAHHLFKVFRL